eukprot:1817388-Alexandrium_andersonii.AAC.1
MCIRDRPLPEPVTFEDDADRWRKIVRSHLRYVRFASGIWQTLDPKNCPGTLQIPYRAGGKDAKGLTPDDVPVGMFGLSKCTGPTPPVIARNLGRGMMQVAPDAAG